MSDRWFRHQHVIFDCDSTLSKLEGIDELAKIAGLAEQVGQMTNSAMVGEIELEAVYGKRLELIRPSQANIKQLKIRYQNTAVEDASVVIRLLKQFGHDIYIVSGGLIEPIREFGLSLGIKEENICAVGVNYNQLSRQWWLYDSPNNSDLSPEYLDFHQSPLTLSEGKKEVIKTLLSGKSGRSVLIGDGMSDLLASEQVDQFIGYGGVVSRQNVKKDCDVFINCESLLPLLALCGGGPLISNLKESDNVLYKKAFQLLDSKTNFSKAPMKSAVLGFFN